jgi:hypothetical protein
VQNHFGLTPEQELRIGNGQLLSLDFAKNPFKRLQMAGLQVLSYCCFIEVVNGMHTEVIALTDESVHSLKVSLNLLNLSLEGWNAKFPETIQGFMFILNGAITIAPLHNQCHDFGLVGRIAILVAASTNLTLED